MNGKEVKGKKIEVCLHQNKQARANTEGQEGGPRFTNIFVKNLEEGTDEKKLKDLFAEFGEIDSVIVKKDATGKPTNRGFVNFK